VGPAPRAADRFVGVNDTVALAAADNSAATVRLGASVRLRPGESGDGRHQFVGQLLRVGALRQRAKAATDVVVQELQTERGQGVGDRGQLGEDVEAGLALVDHALQAFGLPFDAPQPQDVGRPAVRARRRHAD